MLMCFKKKNFVEKGGKLYFVNFLDRHRVGGKNYLIYFVKNKDVYL